MRATVILKNLSCDFWNGSPHFPIPGFLTQSPSEQWKRCNSLCAAGMATIKVGRGSFMEQIELDQICKNSHAVTCSIEPRKGYKLAVFEFYKT